ncbi:ParA family protein [Acetivibrio cellulolyticus]|uniref:ParA family protein n=1 Tax=Acetivibrio cellulolyticus TaxID=35830 RepID=UPI0001E2C27B|nr:AAA family ATPase [Acetivibrio cellulolyticus]
MNAKIIAVANQKGGVAKTTSVRNMAFSLGEQGKKVLALDFDPQSNLTSSFADDSVIIPNQSGVLCNNGANGLYKEHLED